MHITDEQHPQAWRATWALAIGFLMIMIDSMIVSVSLPAIMRWFSADVTSVMWVSSAYLLTYAIPLMISGRLGDRFGPARLYLIGLVTFTVSSLWCGLSTTITSLILARGAQGLGAAMMSPQTMAVITRVFPPQRRGAAMGVWGATASLAAIVGPILGGVLVDGLDWRWIFFINIPIGVVGCILVWRWVPKFAPQVHRWDWRGVILNAAAVTLLVLGIQEGQSQHWPAWIIAMIVVGASLFGVFVWSQAKTRGEPLMPVGLFKDRNFTAANVGIFSMGFLIVAMSFPMMLYLQTGRGLSPTAAALLSLPQALLNLALSPVVGKLCNSRDPKPFVVFGFALLGGCLLWLALLMRPETSVWWLVAPLTLLAVANSCIWGPLSMAATRSLPTQWAGAGSGVYNATRQLGSVIGSAVIAAVIEWQLATTIPRTGRPATWSGGVPEFLRVPFATAMRHAELVPCVAAIVGVAAGLALVSRVTR